MTASVNRFAHLGIKVPASNRFSELMSHRGASLEVARECSRLTKPTVVPPSGGNSQPVFHPAASHGARLVSNLVSQLLLILFPPGIPFFKLDLESADVREMAKGIELPQGKTMYDAMRETFVTLENQSTVLLETQRSGGGLREVIRMILSQLVVGGNACWIERSNSFHLLPLEDWVCTRSNSGELLEIVFRETLPVSMLGPEVPLTEQQQAEGTMERYTRCYRATPTRWTLEEYSGSSTEPYTTLEILLDKLHIHVATWELVGGEDYGRGLVEESLGDLRTYESGTQIIKESATALSKVIFMVKPNSLVRPKELAHARNTEIVVGDAADVGTIQANKAYDMSEFIRFLEAIKRELDMTFMMPTVFRREAERVTAEEIRRIASEFEKSRGGIYNSLANTIQTPVANLLIRLLFKRGALATGSLKIDDLLPIISTGLQGLGRSVELENLLMFLQEFGSIPGANEMINLSQLASKLASLRGLEITSLLKSPDELQMEALQQQQLQTQGEPLV